jgi:hypothetical protein
MNIKWCGPDVVIANYGLMTYGKECEMSESDAIFFEKKGWLIIIDIADLPLNIESEE